ncbi:MAG: FeoA family protein [Solirubrobacterales bacterium]
MKPAADRLVDVAPGTVVRVVEIGAAAADWRERLQAYGLAPGGVLKVLQHAPVTVVRVDRTDLAFEAPIATGILVSAATLASDRGEGSEER